MDQFNLSEGLYTAMTTLYIQTRKNLSFGAQLLLTRCENLKKYLSPLSLIFLIYRIKIIFTSYICCQGHTR